MLIFASQLGTNPHRLSGYLETLKHKQNEISD